MKRWHYTYCLVEPKTVEHSDIYFFLTNHMDALDRFSGKSSLPKADAVSTHADVATLVERVNSHHSLALRRALQDFPSLWNSWEVLMASAHPELATSHQEIDDARSLMVRDVISVIQTGQLAAIA